MGQEVAGTLFPGMIDDLVGIALFHDQAPIHENQLIGNIPGEGHLVGHDVSTKYCQGMRMHRNLLMT